MKASVTIIRLVSLAIALILATACAPKTIKPRTNVNEGERLQLAPDAIVLEFKQSVALGKIELVDQDGAVRPLSSLERPVKIHIIELPLLAPHGYRIYWRGVNGKQPFDGSIGFVIEGCGKPEDVPARAQT